MPLKTRTYTLREERDKKSDRLDELVDREADLIVAFEAATDDGGDGGTENGGMTDAELADLREELEEGREEAAEVQDHHAGLAWAVERFGPDVATDGGQNEASDEEIRAALESDEGGGGDADGADGAKSGDEGGPSVKTTTDGRTIAGTSSVGDGVAGQHEGPLASAGGKATTSTPSTTGTDTTDGPLTVTLGGLTAGEFARVNDINAAQAGRMGFAPDQLAEDGSALTVTVAAGTLAAPYLTTSANLRTQANEVGDLHPAYVRWCRSEIENLTAPSDEAGNDYASRVSAKVRERQAEATREDMDTNTTKT